MNRFEKTFANTNPALIVCDCCGAPDMETSYTRLNTIIENGADIVELYLPFSDPMADGAVLQSASQQALKNGSKIADILAMISKIRQMHKDVVLVVTSYYNIFLQYGLENIFAKLAESSVDAVHIIDLPYEEHADIEPYCNKYQIPQLLSVAPGSGAERTALLLADAKNMVYCYKEEQIPLIRKHSTLPIAVRCESPVAGADAMALDSAAAAVALPELAAFIRDMKAVCIKQ